MEHTLLLAHTPKKENVFNLLSFSSLHFILYTFTIDLSIPASISIKIEPTVYQYARIVNNEISSRSPRSLASSITFLP